MAGDSDVVKRVLRFKLQLTDSTESATVLKILQKLKDLDITLDILAETGIGKTVNSLRRHSEAGDLAKSLVRGWKQLVPKKSLSHIEDGNVSDMSVKDHLDNQNTEVLAMEDSNKCVTSHRNNLESSTEHLSRITRVKKSKEPQKRKLDQQESESNKNVLENFTLSEKNALLREKMDDSLVSKENKYHLQRESDCCDIAEDSAVFTGQRHYKKMQVYSGAKTVFLPSMMSLYQQCIRTLQNNINLLYETGGVPFEILEPVLERCTPEQLLRIEEYNPVLHVSLGVQSCLHC